MRLTEYIIENRSQYISDLGAEETLRTRCSDSYNNKRFVIWRGNRALDSSNCYIFDSSNSIERVSPHASNNAYNLFLSNLPSWKIYPQRNKSLVCSTSMQTAGSGYGAGQVFRVYPYNGTKIGVCPEDDIWESFHGSIDPTYTLNSLNVFLKNILEVINYSINDSMNYKDLKYKCDEVDRMRNTKTLFKWNWTNYRNGELFFKEALSRMTYDFFTHQIKYFGRDIKLIDAIDEALNPRTNHFMILEPDDEMVLEDKEVWFEGKAVLVGNYSDLFKRE